MIARKSNIVTAVLLTAVTFIGSYLGGCATNRQATDIKAEIAEVKQQNLQTQGLLAHLDSTIVAGAEANNRLRADMSTTVDDLQRQIASLLENYNDLMRKIDELAQRPTTTHVLTGSTGVQADIPTTVTPPVTEPVQPSVDCDSLYDMAFIQTRRTEYEQGIAGWNTYFQGCPQHKNVESAHYWMGECYYSLGKFTEAVSEFEFIAREFKDSPNLGRSLYKLARSKMELGKTTEARTIFQQLIDDFPGTLEAEQAKERLKDLK